MTDSIRLFATDPEPMPERPMRTPGEQSRQRAFDAAYKHPEVLRNASIGTASDLTEWREAQQEATTSAPMTLRPRRRRGVFGWIGRGR